MNIAEFGETSTYTNHNGKINSIKLTWDKKYGDKIVDINVDVDNNNKKEHYSYKIPNTHLPKIIESPILLNMFYIEPQSRHIIDTLQKINKKKTSKSLTKSETKLKKTLKKNSKKLVIF